MPNKNNGNSPPVLVGFGKNYYYNFGPAQPSALTHCHRENNNNNDSNSKDETDATSASSSAISAYRFDNDDDNGEEKDGAKRSSSRPNSTPWDQEDDDLVGVECTIASTHFLTRSGKVYSCGTVHGRVKPSLTRITIPLPLKCVQLATGRHFCLARMEGGQAVCARGAGHFGQLGLGGGFEGSSDGGSGKKSSSPPSFVDRPTVIEALLPHVVGAPVTSVAAGYWHSMALTKEGNVFAWGCNRNAQCGRKPSSKDPPTLCRPQKVSFENTTTVTKSEGVVKKTIKITKIAAGRAHSVALDEGGQCYAWGANQYGQCCLLSRRRVGGIAVPKHVEALAKVKIVDISAGDAHTLSLTGGGRVFGWGGGFEGQLGTGYIYQMNPKPKLVNDLDFVAIEAVLEHKANKQQKLSPEAGGGGVAPTIAASSRNLNNTPRVVTVVARGNSSFAISSTGHVYAWGCNDVGHLGLPTPLRSSLAYSDPIQIASKAPPIKRQLHTYSFDSSHNIALPQRLDALSGFHVTSVGASSTFMWCLGTKRHESDQQQQNGSLVGRTIYEVAETKRPKAPPAVAKPKTTRPEQNPDSSSLAAIDASSSSPGEPKTTGGSGNEKKTATASPETIGATRPSRDEKAPAAALLASKNTDTATAAPAASIPASRKTDTATAAPAIPASKTDTTTLSKEVSGSHDSISSGTPRLSPSSTFATEQEGEPPSQIFSTATTATASTTAAAADNNSKSSSPGKKKRIFSAKKFVKSIGKSSRRSSNK